MKKVAQIMSCLTICFAFLCLGSIKAQTTGGSTAGNCAVSVDMVLIGEMCILGGLGIRSGFYEQQLKFYKPNTTERTSKFYAENPLLPITIATKPTKLSWIHFQFFIDFSFFDKASAEETYSQNLPALMTNDQISDLQNFV